MTAPELSCAHDDCCQLALLASDTSHEATIERVVTEALEHHIEAPSVRLVLGRSTERSGEVGRVINEALAEALPTVSPAFRAIYHPGSKKDHAWMGRYRIGRGPTNRVMLDFVVGAGLCVVTSRRGVSILQSPSPRRSLASCGSSA